MVTQARLKRLLRYVPRTGAFYWRVDKAFGARAGTRAGGVDVSTGYWRIKIDGRSYRAHRLAWLYMRGRMPAGDLDHKSRDRASCRFADLREASQSQNNYNAKAKPSRSGLKGAQWKGGRWAAAITIAGRRRYLGYFATAQAAHAAYCTAARTAYGAFFHKGEG